jgi:hypothetical protein
MIEEDKLQCDPPNVTLLNHGKNLDGLKQKSGCWRVIFVWCNHTQKVQTPELLTKEINSWFYVKHYSFVSYVTKRNYIISPNFLLSKTILCCMWLKGITLFLLILC